MSRRRTALVLGGVLVLGPAAVWAPSASAAGSLVSPGSGVVFERDQSVEITALVERGSADTQLRLVDPTGTARVVDTAPRSLTQDQRLAFGLDTNCPMFPGSGGCSGRNPARNGTWEVELAGGATDARTFVLRVPPRAPQGVQAEPTGSRTVVVTWQAGPEADLTGYTVVDGSGARLVDVDRTCPGGTCRAVVTYDTPGPRREVLAVRADRRVCPECSATVDATSAEVEVDRPAQAPDVPSAPEPGGGPGAPAPDPSVTPSGAPAPGGGPAGPAGPAGPSAGPSGSASPSARPLAPGELSDTFRAFGPRIGLPALPTLPTTPLAGGEALPDVAPLPDGSFAPELPFDGTVVDERVPSFAAEPARRVAGALTSVADSGRVVRSTAIALILFLVVAHVRRWLAQTPVTDS